MIAKTTPLALQIAFDRDEWQQNNNLRHPFSPCFVFIHNLSEPIALSAQRAERQWGTLQSEKVIRPALWRCWFGTWVGWSELGGRGCCLHRLEAHATFGRVGADFVHVGDQSCWKLMQET